MGLRAADATLQPSPALAPGGATVSGSTPFESHSLGSLTLTEGVGFEPTWSLGPTP